MYICTPILKDIDQFFKKVNNKILNIHRGVALRQAQDKIRFPNQVRDRVPTGLVLKIIKLESLMIRL